MQHRLPGVRGCRTAPALGCPTPVERVATIPCKPLLELRGRFDSDVRSTAASSTPTTAPAGLDIKAKMDVLKEDLSHLFDNKGVDPTLYDTVVDFRDPITKYSSLQGYLFNIQMLKVAFNPIFELHDMRQTADNAITTRWTMTMEMTATKNLPVINKYFKPTIVFTGTSTYEFNPANGKINRHIDTWDSISNQQFFSTEAFRDFLGQVFAPWSTPSLETPHYTVLRRAKGYEVRKYEPFLVAETSMDDATQTTSRSESTAPSSAGASSATASSAAASPAGNGMRAFRSLAGYIFGKNARSEVMQMTTPVFSSTDGTMQFVISPSKHQDVLSLPSPSTPNVKTRQEPGGLYAVRIFNGVATPSSSNEQEGKLRAALLMDGLKPQGKKWTLARYNDPGTKPFFRRNEVMIPLEEFELW